MPSAASRGRCSRSRSSNCRVRRRAGRTPATFDGDRLLAPALAGDDLGLISEAGLPAVADPGARLVAAAHAAGIRVVALPGASSITLAVAASGLNGQSFAFVGYLPIEAEARAARIRELEATSRRLAQTQVMIETPYRNAALLGALARAAAAGDDALGQRRPDARRRVDAKRSRSRAGAPGRRRFRPTCRRCSRSWRAEATRQVSAASGTLPPNSAATFFFGLMFGERPRATGAARCSHAGSAVVAGGS